MWGQEAWVVFLSGVHLNARQFFEPVDVFGFLASYHRLFGRRLRRDAASVRCTSRFDDAESCSIDVGTHPPGEDFKVFSVYSLV